ncbi:MAG: putative Ig domain-containing protein [Acidobacteriota bacterium]|nr:putative Ig domain-containing protein [Acidobacteriota bacterium]
MQKQSHKMIFTLALLALCFMGASRFVTRPVAGQTQTLHGAAALDRLKQEGQYDSLQGAMRQARLSVQRETNTPLGRWAWRAPNEAAGYDAYVTEAGVSIAMNDKLVVSLHLRSLGYGAALHGVAAGEVSGDGQSITIKRNNISEWFVNTPDGLEHGFTLNEPPSGAWRKGLPLRLALQVGEGWQAVSDETGARVYLHNGERQIIEYGKLVVRDARGVNLVARLTVVDEQVVIEAEDHDAQYPLTIDPLFTRQQKLTAADGEKNDGFGNAVALSGNTAVIGAPNDDAAVADQGSVYVFVRNGVSWTLQGRLTAQDGARNDYFGSAVALDGDTLAVGAYRDDNGANEDQGAVYVFTRSGTVWTQQPKLTANDGAKFDGFGNALALAGDTLVIGAPGDTIGQNAYQGSAYVFTRDGANWTQWQKIVVNGSGVASNFGGALALDGDTLLVGASGQNASQGAAYVFVRSDASWAFQQQLTAADGKAGNKFGFALALHGDTALVGAPRATVGNPSSAYIFTRSGPTWTQQPKLNSVNGTATDQFGQAVALSGDIAVVSAYTDEIGTQKSQGAVHLFLRDGASWTPQRKLFAADGRAVDVFGNALALDRDTLLVGALGDDIGANTDQGSAYVFVIRDNRHVEQQRIIAHDGAGKDGFGHALALSGDTLAVGVGQRPGAVYLFTRNGTTPNTSWTFRQKVTANDGSPDNLFGFAVALDGDTLAVGAPGDGGNRRGAAYIFVRQGANWTQQKKLLAPGNAAGDNFGNAIALDEGTVAVGAYADDVDGRVDQGSVHVFVRSVTPFSQDWVFQKTLLAYFQAAYEGFGASLALQGESIAIGAPGTKVGVNEDQGAVYVYSRNGVNWTFQAFLAASSGSAGDFLGNSVAISGDTVVAGAPYDQIGMNPYAGSAYVFLRGDSNWREQQRITAPDEALGDHFGSAVAFDGDTVVISAQEDEVDGRDEQGSAYVFTRKGAFWTFQHQLTASDGAADDYFGHALALDGDFIAVGAVSDTVGTNVDQGSVYVYATPPCPSISVTPSSLPNGAVGAAYEQYLKDSITNGDGPFYFIVSGGALPSGLTLNYSSGRLSGTPVAAGSFHTVTVTNNRSLCSGSRAYTLTIRPPNQTPTVALVSAASYQPGVAPESIVAAFGSQMSQQTQIAASVPLPTTLAGVSVRVRDSQGVERLAPLFFASPGQINLQIPPNTATGMATVTVSTGAVGQIAIKPTAPSLFAANADGQGVPAAVALRVKANGAQSYEAVSQWNGTRFIPMPIDLGPAGEQVFLVLYGTGLRFKQTATASIGGLPANVLYAGAAAGFVGLDQINLAVPRALLGRGEMDLVFAQRRRDKFFWRFRQFHSSSDQRCSSFSANVECRQLRRAKNRSL